MSEREDNCPGGRGGGGLRLGSLFLPPSVKRPEHHIWIVVNSQAGDGVQDWNGCNHGEKGRPEKQIKGMQTE